jgi:hypothetical protein
MFGRVFVEVSYDGPPGRRLWIFGATSSPWSLNQETLLQTDLNPLPAVDRCGFVVTAANFPGEYPIFAYVLDRDGKVEHVSPRVTVVVTGGADEDGPAEGQEVPQKLRGA